jgi:hypothetical protein
MSDLRKISQETFDLIAPDLCQKLEAKTGHDVDPK